MTLTVKIFWILLATLCLMGFMGSNSVLMASHVTHFVSYKGPKLPQNETGCVICHAAGNLQCDPSGPLFADSTAEEPRDLNTTTVCDPCHSPGGAIDGVNDPDFGAKANWTDGVYTADGGHLKDREGKDNWNWCLGCHDDDPNTTDANESALIDGVYAPNVTGDNTIYGYNTSGHGRPNVEVKCEECHDLTGTHIDGEHRTYLASSDNYTAGYRLRTDFQMVIPRYGVWGQSAYSLCYMSGCHLYSDQFSTNTNFRDDRYAEPRHYHDLHLDETFSGSEGQVWDSDWDGENCGMGQGGLCADSAMSCPACHNVHGSPMETNGSLEPNPVMIRHGELISTPGSSPLDRVPAFDFHWYWDNDGSQQTADFGQSLWGGMRCGYVKYLDYNHVCYGCHNTGEVKYKREPPLGGNYVDVLVDDFQEYADDASLQVNWKRKQDAKKPRLELSGGPDASKCMRVRVSWTKDPDHDYGTVLRKYDAPIDMTEMVRLSFYVKVNNKSRIEKVKVRLKKSDNSTYCNSAVSTSDFDDGMWESVSLPRQSFTCTDFGLVKEIQLRIYEYDPEQSYAQNVYFDDIRFVKPGGQD